MDSTAEWCLGGGFSFLALSFLAFRFWCQGGGLKLENWPEGLCEEEQVTTAEGLLKEMEKDFGRLSGHAFGRYVLLLDYYPDLVGKGYTIQRADDRVDETRREMANLCREQIINGVPAVFDLAMRWLADVDPSTRTETEALRKLWFNARTRALLVEAKALTGDQRDVQVTTLFLTWLDAKHQKMEGCEPGLFGPELYAEMEVFLREEHRIA